MPGTRRYFEFVTADGASVLVESDAAVPGMGPAGVDGLTKTNLAFDQVMAQLATLIDPLRTTIRTVLDDANEVSVEFGVKIVGKAGIVIAAAETEGNFKIAVKWVKGGGGGG